MVRQADRGAAVLRIECDPVGQLEPARRRAHFVSALVLAWPDGHEELFGIQAWVAPEVKV